MVELSNFEILKIIGKGNFGKVYQVRHRDTKKIYAMKCIRKSSVQSDTEIRQLLDERNILTTVKSPFVVSITQAFQTSKHFYFIMPYINGGELFYHLYEEERFAENRARFYLAEIVCAFEALHSYNIIYRDLKPENILLQKDGHVVLCDFGVCKIGCNTANSFCGTTEYLSPELLLGLDYTKSVDFWTLGILLYEMLFTETPFADDSKTEVYRKILTDDVNFKENIDVSAPCKDLILQLLRKSPNERLCDIEVIKQHPFFKELNWKEVKSKSYTPPFDPDVSNEYDTSNFDSDLSDSSSDSGEEYDHFDNFDF
jgi:serum/glucocorticoid-regulated kinase 2